MPDMLGNAVLQTLKQDPETAPIPVMLISNYNENQMMKDAIAQGAVDYVLEYQIETKDLVKGTAQSQNHKTGSLTYPPTR